MMSSCLKTGLDIVELLITWLNLYEKTISMRRVNGTPMRWQGKTELTRNNRNTFINPMI